MLFFSLLKNMLSKWVTFLFRRIDKTCSLTKYKCLWGLLLNGIADSSQNIYEIDLIDTCTAKYLMKSLYHLFLSFLAAVSVVTDHLDVIHEWILSWQRARAVGRKNAGDATPDTHWSQCSLWGSPCCSETDGSQLVSPSLVSSMEEKRQKEKRRMGSCHNSSIGVLWSGGCPVFVSLFPDSPPDSP